MSSTRRARIRSSGSDGRPSSMPTGSANLAGSVPNPVDGDLRGRLSNPPEIAGTLAGQGSVGPRRPRTAVDRTRDGAAPGAPGAVPEQRGRLSNLVQRRLSETAVDAIVVAHTEGTTIDALASRFEVHRTTILHHLDRRGVPRPPIARKMTDRSVHQAANATRRASRSRSLGPSTPSTQAPSPESSGAPAYRSVPAEAGCPDPTRRAPLPQRVPELPSLTEPLT